MSSYMKGYNLLKDGLSFEDNHPTPSEHLKSLLQLFPEYAPNKSTIQWVNDYSTYIKENSIIPFVTKFPKERL